MRVTNKSITNSYLNNLERIADARVKDQVRISTGNDILSVDDAPDRLVDVKQVESRISENASYIRITDDAINEMQETHDKLQNIADYVDKIRTVMIDSTQTGNSGNIYTLGIYVKGMLKDMVGNANADFKGKYLFSGTKTRPESFETIGVAGTSFGGTPFELIEGESTPENQSGLQIVFKGNNENRLINKDHRTTEVINVAADKAFGTDGAEVFNTIVKIVNLLIYNEDGSVRQKGDVFNTDDTSTMSGLHSEIRHFQDGIDQATARLATSMTRLENINFQMGNENLNLMDFRANKADTDIARTSMNLQRSEIAMQYSLKIGAQINKLTLFDYL